MSKFNCSIKIALSAFCVAMMLGSFTLVAKTKPIVCSEKDEWVNENPHQEKDGKHYFIGTSSNGKTQEDAEKQALHNAFEHISKYIKVEGANQGYVFNTQDDSWAEYISKIQGAFIEMNNWDYVKVCRGDKEDINAAVKIVVSDEEMQRMIVKEQGKTDWSFNVMQCSEEKAEEIKLVFKGIAGKQYLDWDISEEPLTKDFQKNRIPKTAYFAKVNAKCNGDLVKLSIERNDLIKNRLDRATLGYAEGSTQDELIKDLCSKLKVVYKPHLPALGKGENPELLFLRSDAENFEKKWRLDPEKAKIFWQKIVDYKGDNPYRSKAQYEMEAIEKYIILISKLNSGEKDFYKNLKKMLETPSFNTEILCEQISKYIDYYGAWVGIDKMEKYVFNLIKDRTKREEVKSKVFSINAESWYESCRQGEPTKCYLFSMKNDRESIRWKKRACDEEVERACFDLYIMAKDKKNNKDAVKYAEKSCYLGNRDACFHAASILFKGEDMTLNVEKAQNIWGDSCLAGHSPSCYALYIIFSEGTTNKVKPDKEQSERFLKQARESSRKHCDMGEKKACEMACDFGVEKACSKK